VCVLVFTLLYKSVERVVQTVDSAVVRGLMELGPRDLRHLSALIGVPYSRTINSYKASSKKIRPTDKSGAQHGASSASHTCSSRPPCAQSTGVWASKPLKACPA